MIYTKLTPTRCWGDTSQMYHNKIDLLIYMYQPTVNVVIRHYMKGYGFDVTAFAVQEYRLNYDRLFKKEHIRHLDLFREMKERDATIDEYTSYMEFLSL